MRGNFRRVGAAVAVLVAALAMVGCSDDDSAMELQCGAGTHEVASRCVPNIVEGDASVLPCGEGTHEESGICVPDETDPGLACGSGTHEENGACVADDAGTGDTPSAAGPVGAPCESGDDCQTGFCAGPSLDPRLTEGYCTKIACSESSPCPVGSACVPASGLTACFAYCDPGADVCGDSLVCQPLSTDPLAGICAPGCAEDADCPPGGLCDIASAICTPPPTCDPSDPACLSDFTCFPTSVSPTGGYCFLSCDDPATCKDSEACQPLGPEGPEGVCVPPPCTENAECPVGATCELQNGNVHYCKPPELCSDGSCTQTDTECVGGFCLSSCAEGADGDTECQAIHPGLLCADSFGACMPACGPAGECGAGTSCFESDWVCLPTGSFPGSPCAPADASHDDPWCLAVGTIEQACVTSGTEAVCVPQCTQDAECAAVSPLLACMESQGLCLPVGSFPGGPCKSDDTCDPVGAATQSCVSNVCVIDCNDSEPATGELLCKAVNDALTCMPTDAATGAGSCVYACSGGLCPTGYTCLEPEGTQTGAQNACLPNGSFPGSACASGDACGSYGGEAMECVDDMCVIPCSADSECAPVGLTCFELGGVCVSPCDAGECEDNRYACYDPDEACLPRGSFPGGPCDAFDSCSDYGVLPMGCVSGVCLVSCSDAQGGDSVVCPGVDSALTCDDIFTNSCVIACQGGACPAAMSCAPGNACLPTGSFPGSPCRTSVPECDTDLGGEPSHDMVCVSDACIVDCSWDVTVCEAFPGTTCTNVGTGYACLL